MQITDTAIKAKIVSGPDRMALANALFDMDDAIGELRHITFRFDLKVGELGGVNVKLHSLSRESGNQTKLWCFEGYISEKARERSGYGLTGKVSGYYNLNDRKGHISLERV